MVEGRSGERWCEPLGDSSGLWAISVLFECFCPVNLYSHALMGVLDRACLTRYRLGVVGV